MDTRDKSGQDFLGWPDDQSGFIDPGFGASPEVATTGMAAGSVAIIAVNTEDLGNPQRDLISFVLLRPIGASTVIYFTDRAWSGSIFNAGAGDGTFTYTAGSDLAAGTVINITQSQLTTAGMNLSDAGDTIYVYQGTNADTPTNFLHAVEIADGNAAFAGTLTNTGLVNGVSAVSIADDNAEFGTRMNNISASDLFATINDNTNWVHNDNSTQDGTANNLPVFTAPDAQIWVAGAGGGEGIVTINLDSSYNSGTLGYQIVQAFQNDVNLNHPSDITLDTVHDKFFFIDSDEAGHNRVVQGSISQLLNNPGSALTLTVLYSDPGSTAAAGMRTLSIDPVNHIVYFDHGTTFNKVNYDTASQTPTVLADLGSGNYVTQAAIDYTHGTVILGSSSVSAGFGSDFVDKNYVYVATGLTQGSTTLSFTLLPFNPDDTGFGTEGSPLPGEAWPVERGTIRGVDIDPVTQKLYIVTGSVALDNDGNGVTTYYGGVYSYALTGNPTGTYTTLFHQDGTNGPVGLLYYIEVDPTTGKYYVIDESGTNGSVEDGGIWTGSLSSAATPTLVSYVGNINGLAPQGLEIQHAPTLSGTGAGATFTETAGNPSPNGTAVTVAGSFASNDVDSAGDTNSDELAGAQVRIAGGFLSGTGHADQLVVSTFSTGNNQTGTMVLGGDTISYSYSAATGVMTFSGITTLDNYETAIGRVQFRADGDNPTSYGTDTSRTIAYSMFDGLLYSDEVNATVTVVGANDAPINVVGTPASAIEDVSAAVLGGISISDVDADPATQNVTVTLSVAHGTITIATAVSGGIVSGDITGGANGSNTITITSTQNKINATLANGTGLTYTSIGDYNGADALTIVTNDGGLNGTGGALSDADTKTINIASVNDAPTVSGTTQASQTIDEDAPLSAGESVNSLFNSHFLDTVDQQQNGGNPTGSVANTLAGIAVTGNASSAGTGQWQYSSNGGASWQDIGTVSISSGRLYRAATLIRFNPVLNYNGPEPTLTVHLVDSSGAAITDNANVNVSGGSGSGGATRYSSGSVDLGGTINAVNDAPVNTVGGTTNLAEDAGSTALTGISIADVDVGGGNLSVTLSVQHGTLNIATGVGGGINSGQITGGANGSDTITITASLAQINTTLAAGSGLTYTPTGNYNGSDALHVVTSDNGNTGSGGALTDTDDKTILIVAANDPVTTTAPATLSLPEDSVSFAVTGLSIADVDTALAPSGVYVVTLSGTHGSLTMTTLTGLTFSAGDGTDDTTMTFRGTLAAINTALATTTYTLVGDYNGSAQITLAATDTFGGFVASGTGSATSDSDTVAVTVTAVNDAPVLDLDSGSGGTGVTVTPGEQALVLVAPNATLADVDSTDFAGGSLTVSYGAGVTASDSVFISDEGGQFASGGRIGVSSNNVYYNTVLIGTISSSGLGNPLIVDLNSNATPAAVQQLIHRVNTANISDTPPVGARTLTFTVADGDGGSAQASADVTITAADDAPVAVGDTSSVNENATVNIAVVTNDTDVDGGPKAVGFVDGQAITTGNSVTLASGATVKLESDGTLTYDPNGKFNYLVSSATATATNAVDSNAADSFSYTLNGGSVTTVNVTVNGIDGAGDQLRGSSGSDSVTGTSGADLFNLSQGGTDTAHGGDGDDGFYFSAGLDATDTIDGEGGTNDQVGLQGNFTYTFGANNLLNIETLAILSGHDTRFGDNSGANYAYNLTTVDANVAAGQQLIVNGNNLAAGESLTFNGSAEQDGSFFFYAGLGTDSLTGSQQSDGFFFGEGGRFAPTDHVDGQGGADDQLGIRGDYSTLTVFTATSMVNIETLALLSATDSRFAPPGTAFNYNLKLDDGNVASGATLTVSGNNLRADESMSIDGSSESNGHFRFWGGQGADTLTGGGQDDQFTGGLGKDTMTGNGGNDTFYFRTTAESAVGANADRITDFTVGDHIDLSQIDADTGTGGDQAFTFLDTGAFTSHAGEARITGAGASWTLQVDTDGNGVADMEIAITTTGGHTPVAADFIL